MAAGVLSAGQASQRIRILAFVALVLANVLWAGTYTAGKIALRELSPIMLNALSFLLAAVVLSPVLIRHRRQIPHDRRTLLLLVQLVLLGFVLNKVFEYFGLALSTASDVALLIATESLFTALLSWTFLREPVTRTGLAALGVGLGGAYLIVERGLLPNLGDSGGSARIIGDLLVVLALLMEAAYTVRGKQTLATLPPLLFTSVTIAGSTVFWAPAGALAVLQSGFPHLSVAGGLAVLYMALIATVTGSWLWFRALTVVDASAAAPMLFIQPLLGAALAIWLLHDTLTWATILGSACILASLLLVVRESRTASTRIAKVAVP
ncbi:MAG TPA: DMT family transporter [Ktedonobacterales bacterium]|jgi:drug/metabolite transporter (DMT)-like permease|nr:DMT family transporter [Ktedonobacterales bacterium]